MEEVKDCRSVLIEGLKFDLTHSGHKPPANFLAYEGHFGALWGIRGSFWGDFGTLWGDFGATLGDFGTFWGGFGVTLS